jgi:hypothetical protein
LVSFSLPSTEIWKETKKYYRFRNYYFRDGLIPAGGQETRASIGDDDDIFRQQLLQCFSVSFSKTGQEWCKRKPGFFMTGLPERSFLSIVVCIRLEATGLNVIVRGLANLLNDDRKLVGQCGPLFDGLYELLKKDEGNAKEKSGGKRTSGSHIRK